MYQIKVITLLIVLTMVLPGVMVAQEETETPVAHLVVSLEGTINVSREGWDILAESPVVPGTSLRPGDYLVFSGSSEAVVLCADLTLAEQFADGVVSCRPNLENPAFYYADGLDWMLAENAVAVTGASPVPADPGDVQLVPLTDEEIATLSQMETTLTQLGLEPGVDVFAKANLWARYQLYYDAVALLLEQEAVQCTERPVVRPTGEVPILESSVTYLRLGEWSHYIGLDDASLRFFNCALQLATEANDVGNIALASARLGDMAPAEEAIQHYQVAIDAYAALQADEAVETVLEFCGSRNCADPR